MAHVRFARGGRKAGAFRRKARHLRHALIEEGVARRNADSWSEERQAAEAVVVEDLLGLGVRAGEAVVVGDIAVWWESAAGGREVLGYVFVHRTGGA